MDLDQVLDTFIAEGREGLEEMERALLAIGDGAGEAERGEHVNAIFRAAHTIKGSAGLFGLDRIVAFTHVVESALDRVRNGELPLDEDLVALLLSCKDHINALLDATERDRSDPAQAVAAAGTPLMDRLNARLASRCADRWHLSLRFGRDVFRNGMDPLSLIRYLGTLGTVRTVVTLDDAMPDADDMDPQSCYLGFEVAFESCASKADIESVFEFVLDDSQIRIVPPNSRVNEFIELIHALPEEPTRLGDILVRCGTLTAHELQAALAAQAHAGPPAHPIGEILVEQGVVQPAVVEAALEKQQQLRDGRTGETKLIRVDAEKLDQLIDLVGELIIAAAGASLTARRARIPALEESHSTLASLVQGVRDSALQLRMVKIGATFNRFQRVVHDVSRELGKDIGLVVSGEDTELDKTVVERIADPLTHLVRNAIDHGIETAELRLQRGKPAQGTVRLNAYHDSGSIVIEVSDDGGGLDRARILAKAVERGLAEPGKALSDSEVFGLIFEPGFSTAEQVTNLSGRGVGMDVVKRNISDLRGNVDITSTEGRGTTVTVRLPLTLAIINGFQVGVGTSVFVVPLEMVEECISYTGDGEQGYTDLRGEVLPLVRLRDVFHVEGRAAKRLNIVVVKHAGQKAGLVVDALLGEFQTVIKPLARMFSHVKGISGSSIRGSGDVALILDVPALMQKMQPAACV